MHIPPGDWPQTNHTASAPSRQKRLRTWPSQCVCSELRSAYAPRTLAPNYPSASAPRSPKDLEELGDSVYLTRAELCIYPRGTCPKPTILRPHQGLKYPQKVVQPCLSYKISSEFIPRGLAPNHPICVRTPVGQEPEGGLTWSCDPNKYLIHCVGPVNP